MKLRPDTGRRPLRIVFVGWGAIARAAARHLADDPIEIVAIATTDPSRARPDVPPAANLISTVEELAAVDADLVVEAAGREAVGPWATAALGRGIDVVVSSVSAVADAELLAELTRCASRTGARILIPPGALGGIDALAAASTLDIDRVEHRIVKPPGAWAGTPAENRCDLAALTEAHCFFRGTAAEAAAEFPKNANVAMTTALAGVGPEGTAIALIADPAATTNRHEIEATGAFGEMTVTMRNHPLPDNPRSSALVALGLVRTVRNRLGPIVI